jgi:hypothetical protein
MNKSGLSTYTEMLRSALIPFRDLEFFTSSSKPLAINIIPRPASKVRISLAGMGALNLTGVEIESPRLLRRPFRLSHAAMA